MPIASCSWWRLKAAGQDAWSDPRCWAMVMVGYYRWGAAVRPAFEINAIAACLAHLLNCSLYSGAGRADMTVSPPDFAAVSA